MKPSPKIAVEQREIMGNLATRYARRSLKAKITLAAFAALLLLQLQPPLLAQKKNALKTAKSRIEELIKSSGAETVGIGFYDLASGRELLINPDIEFHAASTMKVPVMMELYRQAAAKKFSLDDRIPIKNDFVSIADGSRYSINVSDDSEPTFYRRIGEMESIRELMRLMIVMSSNLATNILIERVGADNIMKLMRQLGANHIQVRRGVEDTKAFERQLNNTTTARDLMILMRRIAQHHAVSAKACDEMIEVMLAQQFNEGIPAGVGEGAKVAHKTGSITKINHDAAIVFPPNRKPFVLVVLTRGLADQKRAHKLIADISSVIYGSITP
jgi:beta-lactamase class A